MDDVPIAVKLVTVTGALAVQLKPVPVTLELRFTAVVACPEQTD